jgi:hypothetical protein
MTRIRKFLTVGVAALTLGATALSATPASAQWRHHGGWGGGGWHRGGGWGAPAAAGVIGGLALGAIAAGAANGGYYGGGYGCVANQPVYDDWGNFVGYQRVRVACY